jgi:uncharacterized protein (TIGR03083 family)
VAVEHARAVAAVEGLAEVWGSLRALGSSLTPAQFELETDCPGWSVKDQFSHVIGTELLLEGAAAPDVTFPTEHVRNDLGALNERFVEARRAISGAEVVAEFAALTARRLGALSALDDEAWSVLGPSPIGIVPYVDYMGVRIFDSWVHEQDVRHAVGVPGGRDGAGERVTLDRMEASMPYVLGRRVGAPPGTTFELEITGPLGRAVQLEVVLDDDHRPRAVATQVFDGAPSAALRLDQNAFVRRACGRLSAHDTLGDLCTEVHGDRALVTSFVEQMVVMV